MLARGYRTLSSWIIRRIQANAVNYCVYSMNNLAALRGSFSYDRAVRWPVPVITNPSGSPGTRPGRARSSWMIAVRSVVCWLTPASLTMVQGAGDQLAEAAVRGRD